MMIKLTIDKIDGYNYDLKDKNNRIYKFNIEFYELANKPKVNDTIFVNEGLLREENSVLSFGPIDGEYGREIRSTEDQDILILVDNGKNIYLKRYYG